MALGFLLLAHKNPAQVERLFQAIYRPEDTIVLHFDRRSHADLHRLGQSFAQTYSNVLVLEPQSIVWGGFQAVQVQLKAMALALQADRGWHHFINISGQDFPLKKVQHIDAYLAMNSALSYVEWFDPVATGIWKNARARVDRYYLSSPSLDKLLKVAGLGRRLKRLAGWQNTLPYLPALRRNPPPFHYYGGSNYVALSRAACECVTSDPQAKHIWRWLRHSFHSDEIFIQSILLNSPLHKFVVNGNLHEIDFAPGSPHPRIFEPSDLEKLVSSGRFFARKFDMDRFPDIFDALERQVALNQDA